MNPPKLRRTSQGYPGLPANADPESYGPEGGHMGITQKPVRYPAVENCRRTEVDLEDTAARMRRYEAALREITEVRWPTGSWGRNQQEAWNAASRVVAIARKALNPD